MRHVLIIHAAGLFFFISFQTFINFFGPLENHPNLRYFFNRKHCDLLMRIGSGEAGLGCYQRSNNKKNYIFSGQQWCLTLKNLVQFEFSMKHGGRGTARDHRGRARATELRPCHHGRARGASPTAFWRRRKAAPYWIHLAVGPRSASRRRILAWGGKGRLPSCSDASPSPCSAVLAVEDGQHRDLRSVQGASLRPPRFHGQGQTAHLQIRAVCRSFPRAKEHCLQRRSAPPRACIAYGSWLPRALGGRGSRGRRRGRSHSASRSCASARRSLRRRPAAGPRSGTPRPGVVPRWGAASWQAAAAAPWRQRSCKGPPWARTDDGAPPLPPRARTGSFPDCILEEEEEGRPLLDPPRRRP
jgi:hypothetical protein